MPEPYQCLPDARRLSQFVGSSEKTRDTFVAPLRRPQMITRSPMCGVIVDARLIGGGDRWVTSG